MTDMPENVVSSAEADFFLDDDDKRAALKKYTAKVTTLNVLPQVARKIMQMVASDKTTVQQLEAVVSREQVLSSKILKIANSSFYGLRKEVKSLRQAIVVLGLKSVRDVTISVSLMDMFGAKDPLATSLWEHSVCVGIANRMLALEFEEVESDEAFVCGLLHDFGKVVYYSQQPKEYAAIYDEYVEKKSFLHDVERAHFGFDHSDLGAALAREWNFSKSIELPILCHHRILNVLQMEIDTRTKWMVAITDLSNRMAHTLGISYKHFDRDWNLLNCEANKLLQITPEHMNELLNQVKMDFFNEKSIFF